MKGKKADLAELHLIFSDLEKLAPQTAVHRKKFEFAISQIRPLLKQLDPILEDSSKSPTLPPVYSDCMTIFRELRQLLAENSIQSWTAPTIENHVNYVQEQLESIFSRMNSAISAAGLQLQNQSEETAKRWHQYNTLDLKAISASFAQYLKSDGIPEPIQESIQKRLVSIDHFLSDASEDDGFPTRTFSPIPVIYQNWRVNISDFQELQEIGSGVSAHVFKGIDKRAGQNNQLVAIKKFHFSKLNSTRFQSFQRELAVLANAKHPTLLRLIGATDSEPFCIITEWMNGGSLYHAIHRQECLSATDRTIAAYDIARGMQFLHSRQIVHRDLKSLNALLDDSNHIRICDFGFSRSFGDDETFKGQSIGTPHWMAPELLKNSGNYSYKVDVYAYGIVLWELATCLTPYSGMEPNQIILEVIQEDLRPTLPEGINPCLRDLISQCWDRDPSFRPSFDEIVKRFKSSEVFIGGCDNQKVNEYIENSATDKEKQEVRAEALIEAVSQKASDEDLIELAKIGIPTNLVESSWEKLKGVIEKGCKEALAVLSLFKRTSKFGSAIEVMRHMPRGSVPNEEIVKLVSDIPTGSDETDSNIVMTACRNGAAELCSLYIVSQSDLALALEVAAVSKVDRQLRAAFVDKCVCSLRSKDDRVVGAAMKCLIVNGEARRIPNGILVKTITKKGGAYEAALLAASAQNNEGVKISEEIFDVLFGKLGDESEMDSLAIVTACKNEDIAKETITRLLKCVPKASPTILRIALESSTHKSVRPEVAQLMDKLDFENAAQKYSRIASLLKARLTKEK